jgi:hypothetical protein
MTFVVKRAPTQPDDRPTCATGGWLECVDKAFDNPAGDEAKILAREACPGCPVRAGCFLFAMESGEHGPWAGTNRKQRAKKQRWHPAENLKEVHARGPFAPAPGRS